MESRFTPLLSTNYVPSGDEMDEIHNLLADPVNQLTQIDTEIARLQDTIDQLSLKGTELRAYIASHKALTTPMRRIPQELLQEIFIHCLPAHHNAIMSSRETPLLLGRVCSQWRSVSRATPHLWSNVHLAVITDIPPWTDQNEWQAPFEIDDGNLYIEVVQAWLSRSGDLPLAISFICPTRSYPAKFEECLISCLMQFSHRWRNISLFASSPSLSLLSSLSREAVPLLESLVFHNVVNDYSPTFDPSPDIFLAPRLQAVASSYMKMVPQNMNWSQLTSLSLGSRGQGLEDLTPAIALRILRKSPNLVHCKLEFGWSFTIPFDTDGAVTMPLLETLSIGEGASILNSFFEHLRLPSLVNLEFSAAPRGNVDDTVVPEYPSICALLTRLDSLRELTLSSNNVLPATLVECLKYTPYITRLSILIPPPLDWHGGWPPPSNLLHAFNDEVVALLTPRMPSNDRPLLCPRLKVIECNPGSVSDGVLLTFIQQRTSHALIHNVQHLERVDIKFRRPQEVDILSTLPADVLADTQITLDYYLPPVLHRNPSPRTGLEGTRRLEMPTTISRFLEI